MYCNAFLPSIVPYLGRLPMDSNLMHSCENGLGFLQTFPHSPAAAPFRTVVQKVLEATEAAAAEAAAAAKAGSGAASVPMDV